MKKEWLEAIRQVAEVGVKEAHEALSIRQGNS